jgi:hypothetical protein
MSAQPKPSIVADAREDPQEPDLLADRLDPRRNRSQVLARLNEIYRSGVAPGPLPEGFLPGRLLAMSVQPQLDATVRRIASLWMPWQGKVFDPDAMTGINRFSPSSRVPMKIVFPTTRPETVTSQRIEAFPFRNRIAPGAVDPDLDTLKIDYDFEGNPSSLIRRILDEVVQVAPGRLLGKILFRVGDRFHPIGYFSLRSAGT